MNEKERKEYLDNQMMDYDSVADERDGSEMTDDEKIDIAAREILERHRAAFEELAK